MIVVSKFLKVEQGALTDLIRIESKHFCGQTQEVGVVAIAFILAMAKF